MIIRICQCGNTIKTSKSRIKNGRGKYCSKKCLYKYRIRPLGIRYRLKKANPGSFKKGRIPWNKNLKGIHFSPKTEFKKGDSSNSKNNNWKGDSVGYHALHVWLIRHYGKPEKCKSCGGRNKVQWASKDYIYKRERKHWIALCYQCHRQYDKRNGWGKASKIYPNIRRKI